MRRLKKHRPTGFSKRPSDACDLSSQNTFFSPWAPGKWVTTLAQLARIQLQELQPSPNRSLLLRVPPQGPPFRGVEGETLPALWKCKATRVSGTFCNCRKHSPKFLRTTRSWTSSGVGSQALCLRRDRTTGDVEGLPGSGRSDPTPGPAGSRRPRPGRRAGAGGPRAASRGRRRRPTKRSWRRAAPGCCAGAWAGARPGASPPPRSSAPRTTCPPPAPGACAGPGRRGRRGPPRATPASPLGSSRPAAPGATRSRRRRRCCCSSCCGPARDPGGSESESRWERRRHRRCWKGGRRWASRRSAGSGDSRSPPPSRPRGPRPSGGRGQRRPGRPAPSAPGSGAGRAAAALGRPAAATAAAAPRCRSGKGERRSRAEGPGAGGSRCPSRSRSSDCRGASPRPRPAAAAGTACLGRLARPSSWPGPGRVERPRKYVQLWSDPLIHHHSYPTHPQSPPASRGAPRGCAKRQGCAHRRRGPRSPPRGRSSGWVRDMPAKGAESSSGGFSGSSSPLSPRASGALQAPLGNGEAAVASGLPPPAATELPHSQPPGWSVGRAGWAGGRSSPGGCPGPARAPPAVRSLARARPRPLSAPGAAVCVRPPAGQGQQSGGPLSCRSAPQDPPRTVETWGVLFG